MALLEAFAGSAKVSDVLVPAMWTANSRLSHLNASNMAYQLLVPAQPSCEPDCNLL